MNIHFVLSEHLKTTTAFEGCRLVDINTLSSVPNASCDLITLGNILEFITNHAEVLQIVYTKLRYGGSVIIEGTDVIETCQRLASGLLSPADAQVLLWNGRQACFDMNEIEKLISGLSLDIVHTRLAQYRYLIKARRKNAPTN